MTSPISLPTVIWSKVASFLPPKRQTLISLVAKDFLNAFQSLECRCAFMHSLSKHEINLIFDHHSEVITSLINQQFHQSINPDSKFTKEFLSKVVESRFMKGAFHAIDYLQSLNEEQRDKIENLCFSCHRFDFTDDEVAQIIILCPNLMSLTLNNSKITGAGLAQIPGNNTLKKLVLKNCEHLNEASLEEFFSKATHLQEITLYNLPITGRCLSNISEENQLKRLSLLNCNHLNDDSLTDVFSKATHLQEVN
ncbi:MAG: hypothetical protein PVI40_08730, partial [Chlamydiota bacterium]